MSKTDSMKNFYKHAVQPYSINIKGAISTMVSGRKVKAACPRMGMAVISTIFFLILSIAGVAQNCPTSGTSIVSTNENTYYPGTQTTVAAGTKTLTIGAVPSGYGSNAIAVGDIVLIIQMQGVQISVPPTTTSSFYGGNVSGVGAGMLTTNLMVGKMEFAVAASAVGVGGGTLTVASGLTNAYSYVPYTAGGTTGQYTFQVIRISTHFNIQLGAIFPTPAWNGAVGGVNIINAINQLDMNGFGIDASGMGFRGGGGRSLTGQSSGVNKNDYYNLSSNNAHGSKGEGVAGTPRYIYAGSVTGIIDNILEGYPSGSYARGAPGNAGGGGSDGLPASNSQNSGGGGGGNGGTGGLGGNGWSSFSYTGGRGGTTFSTYTSPTTTYYYSPSRLIMGGGGGAGATNNGSGTAGAANSGNASGGAAGGGLIIISTTTVIGTGTVTANGALPNNTVTVDGSGGGGAGGSILIYANSGQSGITATANGGNGSDNHPAFLDATQHGPGGGGGGGVIYSNGALNIASSVTHGSAGTSFGTSVTDNFGAFDGTDGVLTQTFPFSQLPPNMQICQIMVLPVKMLSFGASLESKDVAKVSWSTTDEVNADYFEVERSSNGTNFTSVSRVDASNTISSIHDYSINDPLAGVNSDIVYYRLRIVDISGKSSYTNVVVLRLDQAVNSVSVFPNPVEGYTTISINADNQATGIYRLMDNTGKQIITKSFNAYKGTNSVTVDNLSALPRGVYILQIMLNNKLYTEKIVKR
jgi:hypothetical protein